MALTREEVQHVALLARIELDTQQIEVLQTELNTIFTHIDRIASLDLEGVEPTVRPVSLTNVTREDEVRPGFTPADALKNAPQQQDNAFLVPRIVAPGGEQ